jgi:hypothetical protein
MHLGKSQSPCKSVPIRAQCNSDFHTNYVKFGDLNCSAQQHTLVEHHYGSDSVFHYRGLLQAIALPRPLRSQSIHCGIPRGVVCQ